MSSYFYPKHSAALDVFIDGFLGLGVVLKELFSAFPPPLSNNLASSTKGIYSTFFNRLDYLQMVEEESIKRCWGE